MSQLPMWSSQKRSLVKAAASMCTSSGANQRLTMSSSFSASSKTCTECRMPLKPHGRVTRHVHASL